jgi:hypothetical protein
VKIGTKVRVQRRNGGMVVGKVTQHRETERGLWVEVTPAKPETKGVKPFPPLWVRPSQCARA